MKIVFEIAQGSVIRPSDDPARVVGVLSAELKAAEASGITTSVQGSGPPPNALGVDQAILFVIENPELTRDIVQFAIRFLSIGYSMWRDYWYGSHVVITVGDKKFKLGANHDEWASLETELQRMKASLTAPGDAE